MKVKAHQVFQGGRFSDATKVNAIIPSLSIENWLA